MKTEAFDLNFAIQHWRENLAQSSAFRTENLNELESHLRDSVAALQVKGLSAEEAFIIAGRRIGECQVLGEEFGKANGQVLWLDRIFWILIGVQAWGVVSSLAKTLAATGSALGWKMTNYNYRENGLALPATLSTLLQLTGTAAGLVFCWWLFAQKGHRVANWLHPLLKRSGTLLLIAVALCFVTAMPSVLSVLPMLFLRHNAPDALGTVVLPVNVSTAIVSLFQLVAMAFLTVFLARKRLRAAA